MNPSHILFAITMAICSMFMQGRAEAANVQLSWPDNVVFDGEGNPYYKTPSGATRPVYPDVYNQPKTFNAPTSKGTMPVTVPYKMPVRLDRVGKAATNFLKRVGPVATAAAIAGVVCDLTDICSNDSDGDGTPDELVKLIPPPPPTATIHHWNNGAPSFGKWPSLETACQHAETFYPDYELYGVNNQTTSGTCLLRAKNNPSNTIQSFTIYKLTGCPDGYVVDGGQCSSTQEAGQRPLTEQDWTDAEPALNTPTIVDHLHDASEPVPAQNPQITTTNKTAGTETSVTRDGTGTATGTRTTEETVTVTQHPTQPNTVTVTTTTVITDYDVNNNVTNTTTINNSPPDPPAEEEQDDPEFDNVQDEDLPEEEIGEDFAWTSWGGGSCPADKQLTVLDTQQTISMAPACDFMTGVRPFLLIVAGLIAAYIIIGVRQE